MARLAYENGAMSKLVSLGALLIVTSVMGSTLSSCAGVPTQQPTGTPEVAEEARCPDSVPAERAPSPPEQNGELAPSGAEAAFLCTFNYIVDSTTFPLTSTRHAIEPAAVVKILNSLPDHGEEPISCNLMGRPSHRVILTYKDMPPAVVVIDYGCATARREGVTRRLVSADVLFKPFAV